MDRGRLTIKMGGLLSFQCADGFLSAPGIEGQRLHLLSPPVADTGDEALPFFSFNRNVFRIAPTRSQVLSAEALRSGKGVSMTELEAGRTSSGGSRRSGKADGLAAGQLQRYMDVLGAQEITYGQTFSLVHADSGLYMAVAHSQPSRNDPDCVSVILVSEEAARSASCEFVFVSRYKVHSDGDKLCRSDEVLIRLAAKPVFLHVSAPPIMESVAEEKEEDAEILERTFRLGANLSFQRLPAGAGGRGRLCGRTPNTSQPSSTSQSFTLTRRTLHDLGVSMTGERAGTHEDAIACLTRDYLDEVNGCEEGGVAFVVHRYDVGTDRANQQRSQLHISRSYVACGVPVTFYHREREAFMTSSVTHPRPVRVNTVADTEGGGVVGSGLRHRPHTGETMGVHALTGAEGRIHAAAAAAATAAGTGTGTGEASDTARSARAASLSTRARSERARLASARATATFGLTHVSATRRLPFPVFAALPGDGQAGVEHSLSEMRMGPTSLWVVEAEDPKQGGPVRLQQGAYRLRHVITGLYLAVFGSAVDELFDEDVDDETGSVRMSSEEAGAGDGGRPARETQLCLIPEPHTAKDIQRSLFTLESMFATECHWLIEQDCLILKNTLTGMYVGTDNSVEGADIRLELQWLPSVADTIVVAYPTTTLQRDALYVYQQCQTLTKFRSAFQAAALDKRQYREQRRESAAAGDADAQREVDAWAAESAAWGQGSPEQVAPEEMDEALLAQHLAQRRSAGSPDSDGKERGTSAAIPGLAALGAGLLSARERGPVIAHEYAALYSLIRQCQDALISLIRFCQSSEATNVLKADGLPNVARQRVLYDMRVFGLVFDVILTPFCTLAGDPTFTGGGEGSMPGLHEMSGWLAPYAALESRDGHVFRAILAASQQRQVLMHTLWDLASGASARASDEATRARLPGLPLTGGVMEVPEIMQPIHGEVHLVCRLAFQLLRVMTAGTSTFSEGWSHYLPHLLQLHGRRLYVIDALRSMFTDNANLPLASVETVVQHFINAATAERRPMYLDFIGIACVFKFKGIPQRQEFVVKKVLVEHPEMLREFTMRDGEVCVVLGGGDAPMPLIEFFKNYKDRNTVLFVESQVALLARLCYDGATQFCRDEVAKKIRPEMLLHILKTSIWTGKERVGVPSPLDVLRSHWLRLAFQCFVVEKIRDPGRQLRISTVLFCSSELRRKRVPRYVSGHPDDEMTTALKQACTGLLKGNPYFVQDDVGRSVLMRAVVAVWFRLVRYRQYTMEEMRELLPMLIDLLDGTEDVVSSNPVVMAQHAQARRGSWEAAGRARGRPTGAHRDAHVPRERLETKRESLHLMRLREMVCQTLIAALDNAVFQAADEVIVYLHDMYTNPGKHRGARRPWEVGGGTRLAWPLSYGAAALHAVGVPVLREGAAEAQETTALLPKVHERAGLAGGRRDGSSDAGAPPRSVVGADGETSTTSGASFSSDSETDEIFERAPRAAGSGGSGGTDAPLLSAADIRDYLDFLNARIIGHLSPGRLVPLLFDVTRYNSAPLTVQAMRLLVQMCVVRRTMAQMILAVNTLPSREVVRSFDTIHDVAVHLRRHVGELPVFHSEWSASIKLALGTLLDSFADDEGSGALARRRATAEEVERAAEAAAHEEADSAARISGLEGDLKDMYSSFALAAKERRMFSGGSEGLGEGVSHAAAGSTPGQPHTRAQKLWARTAGATRALIYNNAIRKRRLALGLSETSRVPMNLVVRAEMMAHWRVHETLLMMLPHVPPSDESFFRVMKFFYFFTLSTSNARMLRPRVDVFIALVGRSEKARALCLNVIVAILGTAHNVSDYLTSELLSLFVQRIDSEVYTKIPDKEFVELLSEKLFSKPTVSVVVRRRMMLTLREHSTLHTLSRPRVNPTVVEVDFSSALVNLVCNICGGAISVLTLAQRMLTSASICRIVLQRFRDNPLGIQVDTTPGVGRVLGSGDDSPLAKSLSISASSAGSAAARGSGASGFKLINPYLRALVLLYFTAPEDNVDDRRMRQNDWMANATWWDMVRLMSESFARTAALIRAGQGAVENHGLDVVEANRLYFLTTAPTAIAAFFMNCYNREGYTRLQPKLIGSAFVDLISACADFAKEVMGHVNALALSVEEVVNVRRLLGVLQYCGERSGFPVMQAPCAHCGAVKGEILKWLAEQQRQLHGRLLLEQEERRRLGISHVNEDDEGAFGILFREEAVSSELQRGMDTGAGLSMSGAAVAGSGVAQVRAALRAILRGNTLIPSLRRQPGEVVLIVNALLVQSTYRASLRESLRYIMESMRNHRFSPRTFVGLLNLFHNSLHSVLHCYGLRVTLDGLLKQLPPHELVDEREAPRMAPEWELALASETNANAAIPETSLAYGLQVVYNALGMTEVTVSLCGIDDDVVTYSAVRLGVALLEGGNQRVQTSLLQYFTTREEGFFHSQREILRGALTWVERVNGEHQYYLLKRGLCGADIRANSSGNLQLVEALRPHGHEGAGATPAEGHNSAFTQLSGWGRVRGSRRVKLLTHTFRLLQLFCEGHQTGMQNYVRTQYDNLHSANMVHESATLMSELSLYITPANLRVVKQGFDLLTELCQGPCRANQEDLINAEVSWIIAHCLNYINGTDIAIGDPEADRINNLSDADVGELRTSMSTTALALIEGCRDPVIFQKMLTQLPLQSIEVEIASVRPSLLYKITHDERYEHHPRAEALYNWLIYLKSVQPYANDLQLRQIDEILRRTSLLSQYLGCIEVSREDGLERVYFRIPQICTSLTRERKSELLWTVDRTSRATKLADFLHKADEVIFAVEQQHDFVATMRRWTRFSVDYDPEAPALVRGWQGLKLSYNSYVAPLVFSYEVSYYEAISMVLAVLVNIVLTLFEGVQFQSALGRAVKEKEVRLVTGLCLTQSIVCLALFYIDIAVSLPVHLYEMYKEKQRYASGKAKFNISMSEVYDGLTLAERVSSVLGWFGVQFRLFLLIMAVLSWLVSPYFAAFNLMLLIYKIPTLRTFITAITANGKQLLLTALLGMIMVYLFSIIGFLLFPSEYGQDGGESATANCDTLSRCFLFILVKALRSGGGVGDVMRPWTWTDGDVAARMTYDMLFYSLVTVVFLNILFGIIIDTFGQMRDEKSEKEEDMHGLCFICGLNNDTLEKTGVSGFQTHVKTEHNMWQYLYFMHHLRRKDPSNFTGQESYVNSLILLNSLVFFPNESCLSLEALREGGKGDRSDDSEEHEDAEGDGTGGGGGGGGARSGGGVASKRAAGDVAKDLTAVRDSLASYLREMGADSMRLRTLVQQLELTARSTVGATEDTFARAAGSGGGGGGASSAAGYSRPRTLAPGQVRTAAGTSDSDHGSNQRMGSDAASGGGVGAATADSHAASAARGGASGSGPAPGRLRELEQQLRQFRDERARLREESTRHRSEAQRRDAELQRLRAELAKLKDQGATGEAK